LLSSSCITKDALIQISCELMKSMFK